MTRNSKRYMYIFTRLPAWCSVKSFCDDHESRHAKRMNDLFKTKRAFAKERRKSRAPYSRRSAFMKARSLNAVAVMEPRGAWKEGVGLPIWQTESVRVSSGGNSVYARNIILFVGVDVFGSRSPEFNWVTITIFFEGFGLLMYIGRIKGGVRFHYRQL